SASRTIRSLYSAVNDRRFGRSGEVALSGAPDRAASRTADAVPSRGAAAADFLTDMFSIVTQSQLALDGNYDRVCCLKHVGTEGRHAVDVRLRDRGVDLRPPARVPTERCVRRAAVARAADADENLARRGHDASRVVAVPDVDALVATLVRARPDEPLQLLLEHGLDGRVHGAAHAVLQVTLEVFLRRDHGIDSVESKGSCWSLHERSPVVSQPGGSLVFSCRPRKRLLHNYRDTTVEGREHLRAFVVGERTSRARTGRGGRLRLP